MPQKAHQMPLLASGREEQYAAAAGGGEVGDGGGGTQVAPGMRGVGLQPPVDRAARAGAPTSVTTAGISSTRELLN